MSDNTAEPKRVPEAAPECHPTVDLAELDRLLARIDDEDRQCKIATSIPSPVPSGPQAPQGLYAAGRMSTTVDTTSPFTPTSPIDGRAIPGAGIGGAPPKRGRILQAAVDHLRRSLKKRWRDMCPHEKMALCFQTAESAQGATFNLNLSAKVERTLCNCPDPARRMSHYISREFRCRLGKCPPYGFAFDVSPSGRVHLHGVVIPFVMEEEHLHVLDQALMAAGGRLEGARIVQQTQNYMNLCSDGLGWAAYSQKTLDQAARLLGTDKVVFISASLKRLCLAPADEW